MRATFRLLGLKTWDIYFKQLQNVSISRIKIENNQAEFIFEDKSPIIG